MVVSCYHCKHLTLMIREQFPQSHIVWFNIWPRSFTYKFHLRSLHTLWPLAHCVSSLSRIRLRGKRKYALDKDLFYIYSAMNFCVWSMSHIWPKGEKICFRQEIDGRTDKMNAVERPQGWALIILNDINYKRDTSIQIQ